MDENCHENLHHEKKKFIILFIYTCKDKEFVSLHHILQRCH